MRTIEIIVSQTGETKVTTKGFAGRSCKDATRDLEAALGKATAEKLTPEYFQQATTDRRLTQ